MKFYITTAIKFVYEIESESEEKAVEQALAETETDLNELTNVEIEVENVQRQA